MFATSPFSQAPFAALSGVIKNASASVSGSATVAGAPKAVNIASASVTANGTSTATGRALLQGDVLAVSYTHLRAHET